MSRNQRKLYISAVNRRCNTYLRETSDAPSPQGWPVPLKTALHPFPAEASRSAQCGHQNRKQSANRAVGITRSLNPPSEPIKTAQLHSRETQKPPNPTKVLQKGNRMEITVAVTGYIATGNSKSL